MIELRIYINTDQGGWILWYMFLKYMNVMT
jgi:hypothetical protein